MIYGYEWQLFIISLLWSALPSCSPFNKITKPPLSELELKLDIKMAIQ